MRGGFTFCDVDIADIGLEYAPTLDNTYVYRPTKYSIHEQSFDGHAGGYYYGATAKPKDFSLRCYFEDMAMKDGIMSQVNSLFAIGTTGRLVFQQREWCWYTATVIDVDPSQITNKYNGFITITLRAYYPFSRTDSWATSETYLSDMLANSALLRTASKNPPRTITESTAMVADDFENRTILLYNPGTEYAPLTIKINGECPDGVVVENATTGQSCRFVGISQSISKFHTKFLVSDGLNAKVILSNASGTSKEYGYLYHDYGFLGVAPSFPIVRDVVAGTTAGSSTISLNKNITDRQLGHYIWVEDEWHKIISRPNSTSCVIDNVCVATNTITTDIVRMNELHVTPDNPNNFTLTRLQFTYLPTFS